MSKFTDEHNRIVARMVRDSRGLELTPAQVVKYRRRAERKLRAKCAELGMDAPAGSVEFWAWLKRIGVWDEPPPEPDIEAMTPAELEAYMNDLPPLTTEEKAKIDAELPARMEKIWAMIRESGDNAD